MGKIKKVFKTFIPYIIIVGSIVIFALASQIWAEGKEYPTEVQFVSSLK